MLMFFAYRNNLYIILYLNNHLLYDTVYCINKE